MEKESSFFEKANNWVKNSITIRLITIGILILLLLIPVTMVRDLIRERENRQKDAIREISAKWGGEQTITGLVLSVPYYINSKVYDDKDNSYKLVRTKEYAHFLPDQLIIEGDISPEMRYRGIYEVIVYNSSLHIQGTLPHPDLTDWKIKNEDIVWDETFVSFGLSDLKGIQENITINWNDTEIDLNPGIQTSDVIYNGLSSRIPLNSKDTVKSLLNFSLDIIINGSSSLFFVPLGKSTLVTLNSTWKNPSFDGAFLPDNREISKDGFTANWNVLHQNRSYPQQFLGSTRGINQSAFGVNLFVPVDEYQKSMRSAKYAVMFITLTFLIFFFVQILNKVRIHPIQYIIVGLALCVFYTLLIALSEHISFDTSYFISSVSIITMITLYSHSLAKNSRLTKIIGGILTLLYLFIYSILQMQDYALLMGSIGLFVVLGVVMYLSRKIDWYAVQGKNN